MIPLLLMHAKPEVELTIQCKNWQPNNASSQLPTLCCPYPPGKNSSSPPSIPGQPTKISLTCTGTWVMEVKGHQGQASSSCSWCTTYNLSWLQPASVNCSLNLLLSGQSHTHIHAHINRATHTITGLFSRLLYTSSHRNAGEYIWYIPLKLIYHNYIQQVTLHIHLY